MKRVTALIAAGLTAAFANADVIDDFDSYLPGPLSAVSGGQWACWHLLGRDGMVVADGLSAPNALRYGIEVGDNVAYSPTDVLGSLGAKALFSFDFRLRNGAPDAAEDIDMILFVGSGDPSTFDTDYSTPLGIIVIDWTGADDTADTTSLHIWDGGAETYGMLELSVTLPHLVWHHFEAEITQTVVDMTANGTEPDGTFTITVDGVPLATDLPFRLDNPFGLNTIETYNSNFPFDEQSYADLDNVKLVAISVFGDLNGDAAVTAADLALLLGAWGGGGAADLDGNGSVGPADLALLLGAWTG